VPLISEIKGTYLRDKWHLSLRSLFTVLSNSWKKLYDRFAELGNNSNFAPARPQIDFFKINFGDKNKICIFAEK
jgi:hypothetical protein